MNVDHMPLTHRNQYRNLSLLDFDSNNIHLTEVLKAASVTCRAQKLIAPIVNPIKFSGIKNSISKESIKEFKLTPLE